VRHDPQATGVVLSPHPDDAVLSAWSALRCPGEVLVVNVCAALPPPGTLGDFDAVFGVSDSAALMQNRLAEDEKALAIAGRTRRNLDFLDAQYRDENVSHAALREAIDRAEDRVAWLCAPAGIGAHPDHVAVRDVALAIAEGKQIPISLYADLPYAAWAGWPDWVTGSEPRPYLAPDARWRADLQSIPVPEATLVARPYVLGDEEAARKLAALRAYHTQFAMLDAGPLHRISNPEVIGYELHWSVRL